ncbi:MAG: ATP-binding cassette domain-containing protein, partial [Gammaproteobacteria bacterium]|nr:ATP-binding cassette domain-containing protein [Gammaproteobacteria bacterium]
KMLTGNLAPTKGSIKIAGIDLFEQPIIAKSKMGYLPDTPPLYNDLSVDEYLLYCAQLHRIHPSDIQMALNSAKQRCGLVDQAHHIINTLSKGFQQRVGIAQAIIHSPDIVILDEPTVGLDPIQMIEIRKLIKELGDTHSVMISSHILPEIQTICSHVQIINQGKLVFKASIEQLNQQMQTHTLRIRCTKSIDQQKISALAGVTHITQDNNDYCIQCALPDIKSEDNMINTAQQIIELAQYEQWGLYEIVSEQQSLEDIFMSLTTGANT